MRAHGHMHQQQWQHTHVAEVPPTKVAGCLGKWTLYLLNAGNRVDGQLLERALQLLIIGGGGAVDDLLLPAGGTLKQSK